MLIVYWPITIKFRTCEQTSKPQTNYRCCLWFSYLAPYWLISRNTITFHKYFWCSRFCEFHSKKSFTITRDNSVIPRCKIDRHQCHFRANILHQQKSHNSKKEKVNWREQCNVWVVALLVANLLCPDKRSLVCGAVRKWRRTPHPLRPWFVAWKLWSDGVVHSKLYADWLFY